MGKQDVMRVGIRAGGPLAPNLWCLVDLGSAEDMDRIRPRPGRNDMQYRVGERCARQRNPQLARRSRMGLTNMGSVVSEYWQHALRPLLAKAEGHGLRPLCAARLVAHAFCLTTTS